MVTNSSHAQSITYTCNQTLTGHIARIDLLNVSSIKRRTVKRIVVWLSYVVTYHGRLDRWDNADYLNLHETMYVQCVQKVGKDCTNAVQILCGGCAKPVQTMCKGPSISLRRLDIMLPVTPSYIRVQFLTYGPLLLFFMLNRPILWHLCGKIPTFWMILTVGDLFWADFGGKYVENSAV
jgi:hypothetical protein